jgi:hypothetical protein
MRLSGAWVCLAAASALMGCTSGSASTNPPVDPCLLSNCGDATPPGPSDASVADGGGAKPDASVSDASSGAVIGWDGSRPPYDAAIPVRDAAWEDGGVVGPGGPVLPGDPPNQSICTNVGPLGFSTAGLTASFLVPSAPSSNPIAAPWAAAAQRTGAPGPVLVLLDDLGLLPSGTTRAVKIGAPRTTAGGSPFGFLQSAGNPQSFTWALRNMYGIEGTTANAARPIAGLRFKTAAGANLDIPLAGVSVSARFVIDSPDAASPACVGLQVNALDLYIPTTAGSTLLEGQTLASLLGPANATVGADPNHWLITLRGFAPAVALQGAP